MKILIRQIQGSGIQVNKKRLLSFKKNEKKITKLFDVW